MTLIVSLALQNIHEFKDFYPLDLLSGCLNLWGLFSSLAVSTFAFLLWPSGPLV